MNTQIYLVCHDNLADLVEDLWQELLSSDGKWEKGRDVGEHTGQDEWVFGVVVQYSLHQLHALIYWQLLHSKRR